MQISPKRKLELLS